MAGWSNAAARAASASILHAPSSSEYSEWTWRWATGGAAGMASEAGLCAPVRTGRGGGGARLEGVDPAPDQGGDGGVAVELDARVVAEQERQDGTADAGGGGDLRRGRQHPEA